MAALIAAAVGIRAATLSDSGGDTWQQAIREDVRRDARIVSDARRLYQEDAAVGFQIAELQARAEEGRRAARDAGGPAAGVLRADAAAMAGLARSLAASSPLVKDPKKATSLTGADLAVRLAELRQAAGEPARLDPDATEDEGSGHSRKGSLLTATVVIVSIAFLCGALAAAFPGPTRRLLVAGWAFAGVRLVAAVAVEVLA